MGIFAEQNRNSTPAGAPHGRAPHLKNTPNLPLPRNARARVLADFSKCLAPNSKS